MCVAMKQRAFSREDVGQVSMTSGQLRYQSFKVKWLVNLRGVAAD